MTSDRRSILSQVDGFCSGAPADSHIRDVDLDGTGEFKDLQTGERTNDPLRFDDPKAMHKLVLVNFFSSRKEAEYRIMKNLAEVAKRLDGKIGSEVFINSVSLDPDYDTFERLQQLAGELQAPEGWCFVRATGNANKELMSRMNRLRGYMSQHKVFYGKPGGFWGTFPGHNSPDELADRIARSIPGPRPTQWRRAGPAKRGQEPRPWTAREVV